MKRTSALLGVVIVCAGCAAPVESARDRIRPVVRQAISEAKDYEDVKVEIWKDLQTLADQYGCGISVGARQRMSEEDRAKLDALVC